MTIKITGVEWKKFYNDKSIWSDGAWHEDELITVDGEEATCDTDLGKVADDVAISLDGGVYFKNDESYSRGGENLEKIFRAWKKKQGDTVIVCSCPNDKVEAVKKAIKDAGGKIS